MEFNLIVGFIIIICVLLVFSLRPRDKYVLTDEFDMEKRKLKPYCSVDEYIHFLEFLDNYQGGYIRRRSGKIVYQDYTFREKGDLKGIFYNIIAPNPNLSSSVKEQFRKKLISMGVEGVDEKPLYEARDSRLRNRETDNEAYNRKKVGNQGERIVRETLAELSSDNYVVINGPVLKNGENTKEFDHIVIGETGLFIIETKAFGMTDGKAITSGLFIDPGDKWIVRKNKVSREVESPTEQVVDEMHFIEDIVTSCPVNIHAILTLSNYKMNIKNNIESELPYQVIRIDNLKDYILKFDDKLIDNDRMLILSDIDNSRVN